MFAQALNFRVVYVVHVHVRLRARLCTFEHACVLVCACMRACVRACVRVCARACVVRCVFECVRGCTTSSKIYFNISFST